MKLDVDKHFDLVDQIKCTQHAGDQFSVSIARLECMGTLLASCDENINTSFALVRSTKAAKCVGSSRELKKFSSRFVDFSQLSLAFSDNNFPRTFHMQTFIFYSLGTRRNFPHEKHFPNDWFSLRFHLHGSRRVFGFAKKIIKLWKNNRKINFHKPREEAR